MTTALVERFETALHDHDVTLGRTTPDEFADALDAAVESPAVGAPLPFSGLSLDETGVQTHPTPAQLREATTGVTAAGLGIAAHGTVAVESRPDGDEPVSLYPERHVAVLRASDIVPDVSSAMSWLGERLTDDGQSVVFATGPSATADMGATVQGVHGPLEVHVLLVETESADSPQQSASEVTAE
jgi:L-lactate dehydrogenase complex protein LldG